jgi:hypothetical protein
MGGAFAHLLCHVVLPYSSWPKWPQTDNSTATHELATGKRGFDDEYAELVEHFGMEPRTMGVVRNRPPPPSVATPARPRECDDSGGP